MAREKKPYDLQCWIDLVNKGQWFMVWERNWVPLFSCRPEFILKWPKERLSEMHWRAAVDANPSLAAKCPFDISGNELKIGLEGAVTVEEKAEIVAVGNDGEKKEIDESEYLKAHPEEAKVRWEKAETPFQKLDVIRLCTSPPACPNMCRCLWLSSNRHRRRGPWSAARLR